MTDGSEAYQAIYFLMTKDPESTPGNIRSYVQGVRDHTRQYVYICIYFLVTKDTGTIPGNTLSYDEGFRSTPGIILSYANGSWNHTSNRC